MVKILGIIPARYASSRFPGKPLAKIGDKTMIEWTYRNASRSTVLSELVVATDDIRIHKVVQDFGGNSVMTKADHISGTDRIIEVANRFSEYSVIVNIQGDEPGIEPELIDGVASLKVSHPEWEMSTAAVPLFDFSHGKDPNRVKVIIDRNGKAIYFSRSLIPSQFKKNVPLYRHLGIYGYDRDFLLKYDSLPKSNLEESESLEQLRAIEAGYGIGVYLAREAGLSVDTPADLEIVIEDFKKRKWII
ncbi:3-deoxy-manno-octulosonate cytidylyltransferase [Leptospira santarosai]|uniref:3-deoxy-manno-octulosonate cytidylyltransferase n=1 Tax=Leptospira santarosai TaxID=28183 RepID=UPI00062D57D1|nr:3-deoxy-manno-octulosonate cytidylyltransferase [Leptospira santarosai]AVV79802.1 3-deoxy-manno-octulosonate cytidylyltransferase [Leptospira santarosai]MBW9231926.1 3-deoxy-manno-octulosonate cytidylyltransferase [Leptospira santarosai]MDI7173847.1 3-deoxy-manno-octulosonate cytidylyltransferase [Leptospira santarosai]MDI7193874.1 3-deoxy-manno-octulosonate cytidylyltransferase [Leptospira santarosai]MDO6394048.1 3-deoxy-manno-octulosonate cytidylyltransferase [Leptospira santarosai]